MKDRRLRISMPVLVFFIFLFVITNIAYYYVTERTLVKEASKRLDLVADYIQHYMTEVQSHDEEKKDIIISNMEIFSELMVDELGPHYSDIEKAKLQQLSEKYKMNSVEITKKSSIQDNTKPRYSDTHITYRYSNDTIDYELILTNENEWSIQKHINERLNGMINAKTNYYKGQKISYEFALFENGKSTSLAGLTGFGSYALLDPDDISYINKAVNVTTIYIDHRDSQNLEKYFMPLNVGGQNYVLCIISDYNMMKKVMMDQVGYYIYAIAICSVLFLILCFVLFKTFNKNKNKAVESVHIDYEKSMETIFLTIRQQRHDYNNAMATLHSLVALKAYDELQRFTGELIEETHEINSILNINCAPLVALIQYKHTDANNKGIKFSHEIMDFTKIENFKYRINDIIRVISNLIDNAMDAALERKKNHDSEEPEVSIIGYLASGSYIFEVMNNGYQVDIDSIEQLIQPGYTTKDRGSGLGLSIVESIVNKNKGRLTCKSTEATTVFRASFSIYK